jgi:hypothetical protein
MRRLVLAFLAFCCMGLSALGQTLDCSKFRNNEDGSWTPISQFTITNQNGSQVSMGREHLLGPASNSLALTSRHC